MSTPAPALPVAEPTAAAPAPKLNAIQMIEQEIAGFLRQREQAIANVHAVDGAIQAGNHLLAKLRAAAAEAKVEVEKGLQVVETEAVKIEDLVKSAL